MAPASDEYPQPPGPEPWWADAWEIDFVADSGLAGFVRLALLPTQGVAWWWTSLLIPRLVAVRDHEVPLPRTGLEVRADGLWGELVCETPLEHWSIGLEAFGIGYDDPADAWGDEWGERLPVGLDLEWEATGGPAVFSPAGPHPGPDGIAYSHAGRVHGEILVGPDRFPISGLGFRSRASGLLDWWAGGPYRRLSWATTDRVVVVETQDENAPNALVLREEPVTVLGEAPVLVTAPGRPAVRLARAVCQIDGEDGGTGWAEWFPA
jgi:hypothetical protein